MKENLQKDLGREPTDGELAEAMSTSVGKVRRHMEAGQAARNKLIKVTIFSSLFCFWGGGAWLGVAGS